MGKIAENVTLIPGSDGKGLRLGRMRDRGHQILDRLVNEATNKDRRIRGVAVLVVYRDEQGSNLFHSNLVCEDQHEIVAALDQASFKLKLDSWTKEE